jgi:hypothetical protein
MKAAPHSERLTELVAVRKRSPTDSAWNVAVAATMTTTAPTTDLKLREAICTLFLHRDGR